MSSRLLILKNIKIDTKIGNEYQIIIKNASRKKNNNISSEAFKGKLIQETIDFLTFRHSQYGYCECFLKIDFALDIYQLREKGGNGRWTEPLKVKY